MSKVAWMSGTPERALACAIIRMAVRNWRKAMPGSDAYKDLVWFFGSGWCAFLWESVMEEDLGSVLRQLGVPDTFDGRVTCTE